MAKAATKPIVKKEEEKYRNELFPDVKKVVDKNMLCTSCNCSVKELVFKGSPKSHPFLETLLCDKCFKLFGDGDFSVDEDGSDKYCRWCGQGGTLYLCSKCTTGFCRKCIKRNLPRSILKGVEEDDWECLICNVKPLYELRANCWAAMKFAETNTKGKSESSSRKRKGRKADSDDEGTDASSATEESSNEETSEDSRCASSRKSKRAKKDDKESSDEEASKDSQQASSRKSRWTKKSDKKSSDETTPFTASKKSRKSLRDKKSKSKSEPGDGDSSGYEASSSKAKDKAQAKQFKLARSRLSTVVQGLIQVDMIMRKLIVTFSEFTTNFEETVAEMENRDVTSKEDKIDAEESDHDKSTKGVEEENKEDNDDVEMKDAEEKSGEEETTKRESEEDGHGIISKEQDGEEQEEPKETPESQDVHDNSGTEGRPEDESKST